MPRRKEPEPVLLVFKALAPDGTYLSSVLTVNSYTHAVLYRAAGRWRVWHWYDSEEKAQKGLQACQLSEPISAIVEVAKA